MSRPIAIALGESRGQSAIICFRRNALRFPALRLLLPLVIEEDTGFCRFNVRVFNMRERKHMISSLRQWTDVEGLQFFCRHLVALCVTYQKTDTDSGETPHFAAYSGTLIQIQDTVCFLTAGHVLRNVEDALKSDQVKVGSAVLADTFGLSRVSEHPIPFDLANARLFYVDEEGLDFGVIALEPYYVRLLSYNGTVALREQNWIYQSTVKFDGYAMLGLPDEFISSRLTSSSNPTSR